MNRTLIYIIGMMVLLVAPSCSKESAEVASSADYVDVQIATSLEGSYLNDVESRVTINDSGVDEESYNVRYTIELRSVDGTEVIYSNEKEVANIATGLNHSFRAVKGDYKLLIFADYKGIGGATHYDNSDLTAITISTPAYVGGDASRDCYGYCGDIAITESFSLGAELKRLVAKMVVKASADVSTSTAVEIEYGTSLPIGYNLFTGKVISGTTIVPTYLGTSSAREMAFDYIFAGKDAGATNYSMVIKVGDKSVGTTAPLEQNKVTNITATF